MVMNGMVIFVMYRFHDLVYGILLLIAIKKSAPLQQGFRLPGNDQLFVGRNDQNLNG